MTKTKIKLTETELIIPELEELAKTYKPITQRWTPEELAILIKYGIEKPVSIVDLGRYLPGRTLSAIKEKRTKLMLKAKYDKA